MTKSELLKKTRQYFWSQDFEEVEVPYLNSSLPLEPNLYSFTTIWEHTQANFYLPASPELALKRHLAAHQNNCFAIGHCFRDLESAGPQHTPEFLMLEWYEVGVDLKTLMSSVENYINQFFNFPTPFKIITLPSHLPDNEPDFNQYFLNNIENKLPQEPTFVIGYPAFLSPLASADAGNVFLRPQSSRVIRGREDVKKMWPNQPKANRFELYINGIEIANGCEENRDPVSIKKAFEAELNYRQSNHLPFHPYSEEFIDISAKIPYSSGVGLGLDRLHMLANNCQQLS